MAINRTLVNWSRTIHIYFSIGLLIILVFFSVTGITLNHADTMTAEPETTVIELDTIPELPLDQEGRIAVDSPELASFILDAFGVRMELATVSEDYPFLLVDYQGPGTQSLIEIDQEFGSVYAERTDYGFIAVLNDLHKARNTDIIWYWLVDISAVVLVLFSLAGFILLLPSMRRFRRISIYTVIATALLSAGYFIAGSL